MSVASFLSLALAVPVIVLARRKSIPGALGFALMIGWFIGKYVR